MNDLFADTAAKKDRNHAKQKEKLGLAPAPKGSKNYAEPTSCMEKVEVRVFLYPTKLVPQITSEQSLIDRLHFVLQVEKQKQDDGLSDLSDILGDLKNMAVDMGSEIERFLLFHSIYMIVL